MPEQPKKPSPPYATFASFSSFINKLRETGVPSRIDATLFGKASGTVSYSVIAAMKYLGLIDENGAPKSDLTPLVMASDEERKPLMAALMRRSYPSLFAEDTDLRTMTAGQFDERIRKEFGAAGSTVDKIAAFFLAGAKAADIEVSTHLKSRKTVAASSSSRKSAKQRKAAMGGSTDDDPPPPPPPPPTKTGNGKPLEYQLIDLMSEPDIADDVKTSIWNLVQYLMSRKAKSAASKPPAADQDNE